MTANRWIATGAALAFLGVVIGAFGAHGLQEIFAANGPNSAAVFHTGAQYHMYHALALLGFGVWMRSGGGTSQWPAWCFAAGILVFSGSLYLLAITGHKWLGAITPVGGLAFMAGWLGFSFLALRN